ncbi:rhodanese-like domain-containing protein [Paraburkholderia terrae]|uniref:hypothetical protein n=1 Tax=Paraburkholderia terrae TaxID=311230 RepID=UPI00296AA7CB|nr:hypothetical protein [Paraburkholderia terrae]MDW3657390.1 hypothetical protein [Paraburkholderia terrae]
MDVMEWLCQRQEGFGELRPEERHRAAEFAMMWTFFEAKVCANEARPSVLIDVSNELVQQGAIEAAVVSSTVDYFKARYVSDGALNERFPHLHFPAGRPRALVIECLQGEKSDTAASLAASLLIVLRYRNNFFHGTKWGYNLRDQTGNFEIAINLLRVVMDAFQQICPERR